MKEFQQNYVERMIEKYNEFFTHKILIFFDLLPQIKCENKTRNF